MSLCLAIQNTVIGDAEELVAAVQLVDAVQCAFSHNALPT